jgi:hypothetical protein
MYLWLVSLWYVTPNFEHRRSIKTFERPMITLVLTVSVAECQTTLWASHDSPEPLR